MDRILSETVCLSVSVLCSFYDERKFRANIDVSHHYCVSLRKCRFLHNIQPFLPQEK